MKLSIVASLYYSSNYIEEFCHRIIKVIPKEFDEFDIILINDGSPDNSLEVALSLKKKIPQITVIDLSRNFGHHKAMMTGLNESNGDFVFLIDIDLEEEPELLELFWKEFESSEEIDVVYGVQKSRKGSFFEQFTGKINYYLYNKFAEVPMDENLSTVRLMTRNYVQSLKHFTSQDFYIGSVFAASGFTQKKVFINKLSVSPTTYSFYKKYHLLINSIFANSVTPLYFLFYFGIGISAISFTYMLYLLIKKLFFGAVASGWTSLMVAIFFSLGIIVLALGIVAIYLSKIHRETKKTPFSIVKRIYKSEQKKL